MAAPYFVMLKSLIYTFIGLILAANMLPMFADEEAPQNWVSGSELEELWKSGKLNDISQRELKETLLQNAPWWEFTGNQWRTLDNEQCFFASQPMKDVLFVWGDYETNHITKAKEDEAGIVKRLIYVSSLIYLRKNADSEEDQDAIQPDTLIKNLSKLLGKPPKMQRDKNKTNKESKLIVRSWIWSLKMGTATLEVGFVRPEHTEIVDYVILTLTPNVKRKQIAKESPSIKYTKNYLENRLSEWKLHNADKFPNKSTEEEEEYGLPISLAFISSLGGEAEDLHRLIASIRGRGDLIGVKAWTQLAQDLARTATFPKNNKTDKKDIFTGIPSCTIGSNNVPFEIYGQGYQNENQWVKQYNTIIKKMRSSLPASERDSLTPITTDYQTENLIPDVLARMRMNPKGAITPPSTGIFVKARSSSPNDIITPTLLFVTHGIIDEEGHKKGTLRTNVRLFIGLNDNMVEYIEFRRRGLYRSALPVKDTLMISEYYKG